MTDELQPTYRYERGRESSRRLTDRPANSWSTVSATWAVTSSNKPLGMSIPYLGSPLRDRELATVSMLAAKGGCEPQLDAHLRAALNVGLTVGELREVLIQIAPYAGFPAAINAMRRLQILESDVAMRENPSANRSPADDSGGSVPH